MSTAISQTTASPRLRNSPAIYKGFALWNSTTIGDVLTAKTLSWDTGAPNHTAAQGSVYIRLDASDSDLVFYRNTDGAATWETVLGSELTDLLGAANTWALLQTLTTGALIQDAGVLKFGTDGADVVFTADGTDVDVTGTGKLDFRDDVAHFVDPVAPTKRVRIDAGTVTAGQTRVLAMPDADVTLSAFAATFLDDANEATLKATLNLEVGTDTQAYDAGLTSLALLATAGDKFPYTTAADTYAEATLTAFGRSILDDADEATFKATVNLEIGTDVQAYSAVLSALATDGLDTAVVATVACADAPGGATTALLSVQLKRRDNSTNVASARQVLLLISPTQYSINEPVPDANLTLGTVTNGAVIATPAAGGLFLIQTDAAGLFACTATNTADNTRYLSVRTAETGVSVIGERCVVLGTNSDSAAWSA